METRTIKSKRGDNRGLAVLLGCLIVVVVGLVVSIVVVKVTKDANDGDDDVVSEEVITSQVSPPTEVDEMSLDGENLLEEGTVESFDSAMRYFDEKSKNAADDKAYFNAETVRVYLLIENGYLTEAIQYLDGIQTDRLDEYMLTTYYDLYRSVYEKEGNEAKMVEYQKKMDDIVNKVREGAWGAES